MFEGKKYLESEVDLIEFYLMFSKSLKAYYFAF